jgi:hypothetical protein
LGGAAGIDLDAALIDLENRPPVAEREIAARFVVLVLREDLPALGVILQAGQRNEADRLIVLFHEVADIGSSISLAISPTRSTKRR